MKRPEFWSFDGSEHRRCTHPDPENCGMPNNCHWVTAEDAGWHFCKYMEEIDE